MCAELPRSAAEAVAIIVVRCCRRPRVRQYSVHVVWGADAGAGVDAVPAELEVGPDVAAVVPQISVVLCTYNRADRVGAAVRAILDQHGADLELIVVDDGSTDGTAATLAAIDDDRMTVVHRPNGGLSAARNSGLAAATAPWAVFIDDDDEAMPGWLAAFVALGADESVGIACCGALYVDADGNDLFAREPQRLGPPFGDAVASTVAGTFAVRTDLARQAGGYLDGLGTRHQTELFLRLLALAEPAGLRVACVPDLLIHIEAREATDRPGVNPRRLYDGTRWIMARHPTRFPPRSRVTGLFEGVLGINAARLGDWRAARRHLVQSVRATPRSREAWARLALAAVPPLGNRVWNRRGDWATHDPAELGVLRQPPPSAVVDVTDGTDDPDGTVTAPPRRELFLPWGYKENPPPPGAGPVADEGGGTVTVARTRAAGVAPAQRLAARLAPKRGWGPPVEIRDAADGPDHGGAPQVPGGRPPLVVCHDALHRVDDPVALLHQVSAVAGDGPVLLSTPDRAVSDPGRPLGPPSDPRSRREWTPEQLDLLLLSCGLEVERAWRVPSSTASWRGRLAARLPWVPVPGAVRDTLVVLVTVRS